MFKLNGFKKVGETKTHTIMRHENEGHEIHINHAAVSPEHRKMLSLLPEHTFAEGGEKEKDNVANFSKTVDQGGTPSPTLSEMWHNLQTSASAEPNPKPTPKPYADGGEVPSNILSDTQGGTPVNPAPAAPPAPEAPAPVVPVNAQGIATGFSTSPQLNLQTGLESQLQGIAGKSSAEAKEKKEEASILKEQAANAQSRSDRALMVQNKLEGDRSQALQDYKNSGIDPDRYLHNLGTGGKIGTAIGLILGGIGGGLTHQENPALKFLNEQINRDMEAQREQLGTKHNLLSAAIEHYRDQPAAEAMMRVHANDIYADRLLQAGAKVGTPLAIANAKMAAGQLLAQNPQIIQQEAMRQAALKDSANAGPGQLSNQDPARAIPYLVPEKHQEAVSKEIERAQDTHKMGDSILQAFDQAAKDTTLTGTYGGLKTPRSSLALHQALQPTFKDLEGTVRQAAMDNTFKNITPSLADTAEDLKTKRRSLEQYIQSKSSAPIAKAFGIDLQNYRSTNTIAPHLSAQDQQAAEFAASNPQDPRSQQISALLRKKYGI
jgi:hypothetical protein